MVHYAPKCPVHYAPVEVVQFDPEQVAHYAPVYSGRSFLFFGTSNKTSDFLVDGLEMWWQTRKDDLSGIKKLVINMDSGPECNGRRSQFLHRITEFADSTGMEVHLIYYPPYHSKYNSIERYWAGLERSWNSYLLDSMRTVLFAELKAFYGED